MTDVRFERDGWIEGVLDDADESATYTRLRVRVGDALLTRNFSKRGGGESGANNVPLLPLAIHLAETWWPLLHEPLRAAVDHRFPARHRLDLPMHGFVFPAMAVCSAGDAAVEVDWANIDTPLAPLEFLTPPPPAPVSCPRGEIEGALMDLVESALARSPSRSAGRAALTDAWGRVTETFGEPGELSYCVAAGRLGLDPYDSEAPDLGAYAEQAGEDLFNDIADAVRLETLGEATAWANQAREKLDDCPEIDLGAFGPPPLDQIHESAGVCGSSIAKSLRARLGASHDAPRRFVDGVLGAAAGASGTIAERGPYSMTALIRRDDHGARVGAVAHTARQRRFRACAAAYLAWTAGEGETRAGTIALTRRQQASRAFAAELVAPEAFLWERAGRNGFTDEDLEALAGALVCPYDTVLWQAARAGIPLPGVEIPARPRRSLF